VCMSVLHTYDKVKKSTKKHEKNNIYCKSVELYYTTQKPMNFFCEKVMFIFSNETEKDENSFSFVYMKRENLFLNCIF